MLAPGHIALGLTVYTGACHFVGYPVRPELYAAAAFGSLLPDIDHPSSQVGRMFPKISKPLAAVIGHRGFTHSLLATLLFAGFLMFVSTRPDYASLNNALIAALSLGYLSHLVGDFLTVSGIPFFWPYRKGTWGSLHIPVIAFRTGGPVEILLTAALTAFLAAYYADPATLGSVKNLIPAVFS